MPNHKYAADTYDDQCSICGKQQSFVRTAQSIRETYRCGNCRASLREREQARAILNCYDAFGAKTLQQLATLEAFKRLTVYEPGTVGPFRRIFRELLNYKQSDYYSKEDRELATLEMPHQSLEALTYPDSHFDLIITSDILEHVRKPSQAFAETGRVLKLGGYHVFTVPLQEPLPLQTITRVDVSGNEDVHILPEHYHGNGKGGRSLVYNDFGRDILDMLFAAGFSAFLQRADTASQEANRAYTVIARRK